MSRNTIQAVSLLVIAGAAVVIFASHMREKGDDASPRLTSHPQGVLTFSKHIAPVVFAKCAPCHRPGEAAPFPLLTYADVKKRAGQIVDVTGSRFMPPWLPKKGLMEYSQDRSLSDDEIGMIRKWVAEGAAEGNREELPPLPVWTEGWQLGEPDLVLIAMPEPFLLPAEGSDIFRNFVIPEPVASTRFIRAVEFRPGNRAVVHHAELLVDPTRASRRLDAQDPQPGYAGMEPGFAALKPSGHFVAWTPGKTPSPGAADMAWKLEAGNDLVLHMHLLPSGGREKIQSSIGLFFAEMPPSRIPVMIRLGTARIDIPAGAEEYVVKETFRVPADVHVLSLYPHAHYLCREMQGDAHLPDGTIKRLIHIAAWDFNWQDEYRLAEPLLLPAGTELVMRFTYDNSSDNVRNPNQPPLRVVWGPRSSDEMGDLWIQVLPRHRRDLAAVQAAVGKKNIEFLVDLTLQILATTPDDIDALTDMCRLLTVQRKFDDALKYVEHAMRVDPDNAKAHNNAGALFEARSEPERATTAYQRAVECDPEFAIAQRNLGMHLAEHGDLARGRQHLEQAVRVDPTYAEAHMYLGRVLEMMGLPKQAADAYERSLKIRPHSPLANAYSAWLLATCGDSTVRDPANAVRRATHAAAIMADTNADILDTLAAAYAAAGQFDRAQETAQKALVLASEKNDSELSQAIRRRLELYKHSRPYREGPTMSAVQ